ncbi:hypothetical protein [Streptomyces sp. ISL-96]|uniref:hypothetical protein n=1 Tax=Streptomyces sp. ISL-96 TaxID=2819191 RepID=UPI0027E3527B|nr:hypothetical protein [Streptomyces sp. ISL-96]
MPGDLPVGQSLADEGEHLTFAFGQALQPTGRVVLTAGGETAADHGTRGLRRQDPPPPAAKARTASTAPAPPQSTTASMPPAELRINCSPERTNCSSSTTATGRPTGAGGAPPVPVLLAAYERVTA